MPRPNVEAQRREQILSAACEVIADIGMQSLRMTDVAKRAGVSSGTIHYYFESKRDVINAAFELNYERSLQSRRELLEDHHTDALTTLRDLAISYLPVTDESIRAWRVWAELWAQGMRDETLQEINSRLYGQWRDLVRMLVEGGQRRGQIVDGDAVELADNLVAMIDGMSVQNLMRLPEMTLERMLDRVNAYVDALAA
ncbi:TetR/AcrR family transcriptional regulator [Gordonia desulfuricans]|uniref:TetR/AcrR family transcriptional regulator n=1 Tax=Gordonia desulfuricans TaxID=89051 RepID=A0A7K3LTH7_9ACTN|nr:MULTISPECIES: TetR/AcrR family transcriptional regulator [Gordonia]EMP13867.2 TetR family transcriptional regulator [Gordonia sp. NB41Y]NDK91568.1 TetR/AcrR family transcriptional regulator [Gordonia desulfuricans]WLP89729.1 TetR/AcrR family transcriptional regulator [Gordonia sp. NB41Y]